MTVGNIKRGAQVHDGVEHVVGILWMFMHFKSLTICEPTIFVKDVVGYTHFADIMEQGSAADLQ